ncbi:GPP34 family phosphoprotein [Micromonospora sp. KC721]|uniref:GOLPH3/VPS74 family protein n=1 Tax=Micromonospora sp. KC721 TaxID=2530380 RepID=UPI001052DFFA|nr:GPP34 family phosphoprotein [Micromonospora sp. KC721]TDB80925.1 GPP34 family phosphoprotein [Micromonospora sp. KC721]
MEDTVVNRAQPLPQITPGTVLRLDPPTGPTAASSYGSSGFPPPVEPIDPERPATVNTTPGVGNKSARSAHHETAPSHEPARTVGTAPGTAPLIANDFYFLAHNDQTGQARLFSTALSYGLAAGLLAELYVAGRIDFNQGHITVRRNGPTPTDWLQHRILDRMLTERRHTATRVWLSYLATTANEQVIQRMQQAGLLQEQTVGPRWRRRTVHVPTDINVAAWPWARLSQQLRNRHRLDERDIILAGLVLHTQMDTALLDGAPQAARQYLLWLVEHAWPQMRELLADLGGAVGTAVLSHRTS